MTDQQPQGITDLQENNTPATIAPTAPDNQAANVATNSAGESTPEDTRTAQQQIIDQQNETITALLERTQSLTNQINELIRNGAAITDGNLTSAQQQPQASTPSLADDYKSLKDLGAEIGKRSR